MTTMTAQTKTNKPEANNAPAANDNRASLTSVNDAPNFSFDGQMKDVRGWKLLSEDGTTVGKIDSILLDGHAKTPRYLSVSTSNNAGHVLLPIGMGSMERDDKQVRLNGITRDILQGLPRLESEVVTREFERKSLLAVTENAKIHDGEKMYDIPAFDVSRFTSPRNAQPKA